MNFARASSFDMLRQHWLVLIGIMPNEPDNKVEQPFAESRFADGKNRPPFDEQNALKGLRDLDPQAITAIHTHYYPNIFRYARYRFGDARLAEDVTSEVFARLLEAVNSGQGPRTSLRGWLMATVANLVNDHYRKQYRRRTEEISEDIEANSPGLLSILEGKEQHRAVQAALKNLTSDQQNILALRFGSGYSLEHTAEAIGKKVNAVKQLQFRALAALRRQLGVEN
jgi:RNA polymerase sigma-70 factor, ECF subfamily